MHRTEKPRYLILNGDFRKEYEEAVPRGYDACRAVYESHRATSRSGWSEDEIDAKFVIGQVFGADDEEAF